MRIPSLLRRTPLLFSLLIISSQSFAENDPQPVYQAISTLDHYMQAGLENDPQRGAVLLAAYELNERQAVHDTKRLYRKQENMLSQYKSISSDIYGYEINKGLLGTSVNLEGGIETQEGLTAEFRARVIYRRNRWLITKLQID